MKPLYLSVKGINSFIDTQEIFFDRLGESGLFCICGPTGSGKTTLLDSLVLALYGKCSRGKISDYINLSLDWAAVALEFCAEDKVYRVERTFFRSPTKPTKSVLFDKKDGRVIAELSKVDSKIQDIIGLAREEFTQIALIEQGKFSEFLKADKSARNVTVGNLFRLDNFKGLYEKFNLSRRAVLDVSASLSVQCAEYDGDTPRLADELRAKEIELRQESAKIAETILNYADRLEKQRQLKARWDTIKESRKKLADAQVRLAAADKEIADANLLLDKVKSFAAEAEKKKKESEQNRVLLGVLDGLGNTYEQIAQNKKKIADGESRIAKLRGEIRKNSDSVSEKRGELELIIKTAASCVSRIDGVYSIDKQKLTALLDTVGTADSGDGGLLAAENLKMEAGAIERESVRFGEERATLLRRIKEEREGLAAQEKELAAAVGVWQTASARIKELAAEDAKAREAVLSAERKLERARVEQAAAYVRGSVADGDFCPVCGGVVGNVADQGGSGNVSELESELAAQKKKAEILSVELASSDKLQSETAVKIEFSEKQAQKRRTDISLCAKELHEKAGKVKDESGLNGLEKLCGELSVCADKISKASAAVRELVATGTTLADNAARSAEEAAAARAEVARAESVILEKTGGEDFVAMRGRIEKQISESDGYVARFERKKADTESTIAAVANNRATVAGEIKSLSEAACEDFVFDEDSFSALRKAADEAETKKAAVAADLTRVGADIKTTEIRLVKKAELTARIKSLTEKADRLALILKIVIGDRFLEYVAEEYIVRFTFAASEILSKISGGKYTMEYADGIFYVRDFLMGNELRKASTLSGGETFLASLALAIAITREISGYKSFEFFFLDEGFGTLDADSIDVVFDALDALSKETLVGIVTHRSELVERIPNRVVVKPADENSGSRIV